MNSTLIQLLVLAGIAVFLILRLKNVLGTRDGFEPGPSQAPVADRRPSREFEVIEGGPDLDITDHVEENSPAAEALANMKRVEPSFNVTEFLGHSMVRAKYAFNGYSVGFQWALTMCVHILMK